MFGRFLWGFIIGVVVGFLFKPQLQRLIDAVKDFIRKHSRDKDE